MIGKGVTVEGNMLQSSEDGVHGDAASDCEETNEEVVKTGESASHVLLPTLGSG